MLQKLIDEAKMVTATTDAKIGGAVIQVVRRLELEDIAAFWAENAQNEKSLGRRLAQIEAVKNGSTLISISDLRAGIETMMLNRIARPK